MSVPVQIVDNFAPSSRDEPACGPRGSSAGRQPVMSICFKCITVTHLFQWFVKYVKLVILKRETLQSEIVGGMQKFRRAV